MAFFPASAAAKTLLAQTSQANMRQTGLGISSTADAILDDASNSAILTTLGFSAVGIDLVDSANEAAARTAIGAGVGWVMEAKTANFNAANGYHYDVDSSGGAVTATLPAVGAGLSVRFTLRVAGNNLIIDGDGAEQINGSNTYTMSTAGEAIEVVANAAGTAWMIN